ncbi:MAG: iron-containing alcohol dehydrogenase [Erysipelotrichales bacterium]|nr:iron-containing alcohol dehydrogenase [Erysipelotrichales bacterium]
MNDFVYNNPVKVYFGKDQLQHLGSEVSKFGKRVLLTYGGGSIKKTGLYDRVMEVLKASGLEVFEMSGIEPNPRIETVRRGAGMCKEHEIDVILAVGGGSTIDCSKWIAAGACVDFDPWDFFGKNVVVEKALPLVTILTLAATGSEMNMGGVISNLETKQKMGRASVHLFPKVSFLDPTLTYTVNQYQTACGSADIMSHIMETYFNPNESMYMIDSFMEGMMRTVIKYAPIAYNEPENYEARANLMWAGSWGISPLPRTFQKHAWSCHPMEHELSAFYDITHGLGLAIITPKWMRYCLSEENVDRYVQFGVNVFGIDATLEPMEIAYTAIEMLEDFLYNQLHLADTFTKIDIGDEYFEAMAYKACGGNSIKGFVELDKEDIEAIYRMCL